jgi:hypothetical protein
MCPELWMTQSDFLYVGRDEGEEQEQEQHLEEQAGTAALQGWTTVNISDETV